MEQVWVAIGFLGEAQFGARFILQWFASERQKKSIVPPGFWHWSVGGGITLLTYAIYRLDPVFIIGEAFGLLVVLRNLYLIRRTRRSPLTEKDLKPPPPRGTTPITPIRHFENATQRDPNSRGTSDAG